VSTDAVVGIVGVLGRRPIRTRAPTSSAAHTPVGRPHRGRKPQRERWTAALWPFAATSWPIGTAVAGGAEMVSNSDGRVTLEGLRAGRLRLVTNRGPDPKDASIALPIELAEGQQLSILRPR
jgi:hypothetical protein